MTMVISQDKLVLNFHDDCPRLSGNDVVADDRFDVTIKVGKQLINGHKVILASKIPYFEAMFKLDMKEAEEKLITIKGNIDPVSFRLLVKYSYTGQLSIDVNNVESMLITSNYLLMEKVTSACCSFINHYDKVNCFTDDRTLTILLLHYSLNQSSKEFILRNFKSLAHHFQFTKLSLNELIDIISDDALFITSEIDVFNVIVNWIQVDYKTRSRHLVKLLPHVRLHLLTPGQLIDIIGSHEIIKDNRNCWQLIDNIKNYHLTSRKSYLEGFQIASRLKLQAIRQSQQLVTTYKPYKNPQSTANQALVNFHQADNPVPANCNNYFHSQTEFEEVFDLLGEIEKHADCKLILFAFDLIGSSFETISKVVSIVGRTLISPISLSCLLTVLTNFLIDSK